MDAGQAPGEFGPYTLLGRIAVGGMAEVYRALAPQTAADARTVVIKRMLPHIAAEADGLEMFQKEAEIAGRVRHPNVVELLGAGTVDDAPYLVLEYVPGCDLWRLMRWLRREGRSLGVEPALLILRELLHGLQAVHDAGADDEAPLAIVHRDVSPSNVLLSVYGDVKLGDFGIARAVLATERPQVSNQAKGKLGYLSPEQVMGKAVDQRADVFAAGVVAAELLMGRELFAGGSELAILLAIRDANIGPFTRLPIDPELKGAVAKALARDPAQRTPSAAALAEAIAPHLRSPESAVRREIAELVRVASGAKDDADLQRTPELSHWAAEVQPTPITDVAAAVLAADGMRPSVPETAEVLEHTFTVEMSDGQVRGTYRFAELAQALTTGVLGPNDLVSTNGGPPGPIRLHPALKRHLPMATLTPVTMDAPLAREPDIRRNFAGGGFVRGLAETAVSRSTGLWLCEQGSSRKEVYVQDGVPEFVGSNIAGEMLGEYLVARSVLSRGQLDTALGLLPRFDGRLGDTLVSLGYIEPVELFRHIATQVEEKIFDLFAWTAGEASFYRGVPPPPSRFPLGLDVWAVLDDGLERRLAEGLEEERFRTHLLDVLEPTPQRPAFAESGPLPALLASLMEALSTPMPLQEVVIALEATDDPTRGYRAVLLGLHLQLVRWQS